MPWTRCLRGSTASRCCARPWCAGGGRGAPGGRRRGADASPGWRGRATCRLSTLALGAFALAGRRLVAVTALETDLRPLCSDGDWLVYAHDTSRPDEPDCSRFSGGCLAREYYRSTRMYDAGLARTVAVLQDDACAAALCRRAARCATVAYEHGEYRATCTAWAPTETSDDRGQEGWRRLFPFSPGETAPLNAAVRWQHDHNHRLLVYREANFRCYVEWFDVGAGAARLAARHECAWSWSVQLVAADASSAFLAVDTGLCALDPRTPADPCASPLLTFDGACHRSVADLGDGRHIVTGRCFGEGGSLWLELWDLRAAGARAVPVATLQRPSRHRPSWEGVPMCATARGTVLGLTYRECPRPAHCGAHLAIEEWDTARGSTRELFVAVDECDLGHYTWRWADERRVVMGHKYLPGVLFDADPGAVRPQGGGDSHDA